MKKGVDGVVPMHEREGEERGERLVVRYSNGV